MISNRSIEDRILRPDATLTRLLSQSTQVGGIYSMSYGDCTILTNDFWKEQAGGVPRHCFLLATAITPGQEMIPKDEEVFLLRVTETAPLPGEEDIVGMRAEAMRDMIERVGENGEAVTSLDLLTRNEMQFSGLKAKILGTFYVDYSSETPTLSFGSDIENVCSASRYQVFKPWGDSLSLIASFPSITTLEQQTAVASPRIRIGAVRYSSATRRRRMNVGETLDTAVPVYMTVEDLIALKTALLGMTRLGKSNALKIMSTAVCQYAAETQQSIGQLLFDTTGELANRNVQDRTALAEIGPEFVTIFRYGATSTEPGIRPLSTNFFSDDTINVTWSIVRSNLLNRNDSAYVKSFLSADVIGPEIEDDDYSEFNRARRRRAAFYATLIRAGFSLPQNFTCEFRVRQEVLAAVNDILALVEQQPIRSRSGGRVRLNSQELVQFFDALLDAKSRNSEVKAWIDPQLDAILSMFQQDSGRSGYRLLEPLRAYHSPNRLTDYADEVYQELSRGKVVIVDMSLGSETILRFCAERIVNHILQEATRRFAQGQEPYPIQIYLEEAHKLFNRDRMNTPEEADPYVRLAKEAAKYKIGLTYATQEVSSVDPMVLSNTSNWVVTHLNNQAQIKELAKYYDFGDFGDLMLRAEDVGFARLKTKSGRYIVPVQIDLFDDARVREARQACLREQARRGRISSQEGLES